MRRSYYSAPISDFLNTTDTAVLGELASASTFSDDPTQKTAWLEQIRILKRALINRTGRIYFEYAIPRMGKRIDVVLIIGPVIFVLEFKVGESNFTSAALDQVTDYCLDLKNFHETSADHFIAPVLIATASRHVKPIVCETRSSANLTVIEPSASLPDDKVLSPIRSTVPQINDVIERVLRFARGDPNIDPDVWEHGRYCPTPTIIEAALALYKGHSVDDITRHEADKPDISRTTGAIDEIIRASRDGKFKSICFVTGVPGAGKTLVGLNTATKHQDKNDGLYSVFLSGNDPLVAILREALARDHVLNARAKGKKVSITEARRRVSLFIQNVHHFRDECLRDPDRPPNEHVALFDEAQRAWNLQKTSNFMRQRKGVPDFNISEPEYLISCLNRHEDWAVIVCLVGGGQEINTGEAGISEWFAALNRSFPDWHVYISSQLSDAEYASGLLINENRKDSTEVLPRSKGGSDRFVGSRDASEFGTEISLVGRGSGSDPVIVSLITTVDFKDELHLAVSMRSFRAENVSQLVKQLLDLDAEGARRTLIALKEKYPIFITRDLDKAKQWLRAQARGTERYGIVVSSQAERLKPYAIDTRIKIDPVDWFLSDKDDVRSSYYLEDVATEFSIQGLELDWVCVTWDADFRHTNKGWEHWEFHGSKWKHIHAPHRQVYLKNAYRVLMTRARQGMVIVVPSGNTTDRTRSIEFYDPTFQYLREIGFPCL